MKILCSVILILAVTSAVAQTAPVIGQTLPALLIDEKGEIDVVNDELVFKPWSSEQLKGHWTLLQYLAARPSADRLNRWALDAITERAEESELRDFRLYNIINVGDVTFGATGFAMNALKSNKQEHPDSPMIADMDYGRAHWGLQKKSSAILLLDADNQVLFIREGRLSQADVEHIIDLLRQAAD